MSAGLLLLALVAVDAEGPDRRPPASHDMEAILRKFAREKNRAALELFRKRDYPAALVGFQAAHTLAPEDAEITNNLAFLYDRLGSHQQAERFYRLTLQLAPDRGTAYVNLADLLSHRQAGPGGLDEAAELLVRARELRGNLPELVLRQARLAARRGRTEAAVGFFAEYADRGRPGDAVRLEIGDFHRDAGRFEDALAWYRRVDVSGERGEEAARRIWDLEVTREARRFGFVAAGPQVPARAKELRRRAAALGSLGPSDEAERLLREALLIAPGYGGAHFELGELARRAGRPEQAELSYLRAIALQPGEAEFLVRLADLLTEIDPPRRAEAALLLERAVDLRREWSHLHLRIAELLQQTGTLKRALHHVDRYLLDATAGPERDRAVSLRRALGPVDAEAPDELAARSSPAGALARASALLSRGSPDAAMAELAKLPAAEQTLDVLLLEAAVLNAAGRAADAVERLRSGADRYGGEPRWQSALGVLLGQQGELEQARRWLGRAEAGGDEEASWHLARFGVAGPRPSKGWRGRHVHGDRITQGRREAAGAGRA